MPEPTKAIIRRELRERLSSLTDTERRLKSQAACSFVATSLEFQAARIVMIYLSTPAEVDTASLALKAWQHGKTIVVPKLSWDSRRMLPVEITSLTSETLTTTGQGIREPVAGNPVPVGFIDLVVVPGLGFTANGHRIGRGMGFYDRFLSQTDFMGVSCGLAFEEQVVDGIPMLDHDVPLAMLATDRGVRRVTNTVMPHRSV